MSRDLDRNPPPSGMGRFNTEALVAFGVTAFKNIAFSGYSVEAVDRAAEMLRDQVFHASLPAIIECDGVRYGPERALKERLHGSLLDEFGSLISAAEHLRIQPPVLFRVFRVDDAALPVEVLRHFDIYARVLYVRTEPPEGDLTLVYKWVEEPNWADQGALTDAVGGLLRPPPMTVIGDADAARGYIRTSMTCTRTQLAEELGITIDQVSRALRDGADSPPHSAILAKFNLRSIRAYRHGLPQ